jgi:galactonate dehydratase
MRLQSLETVLVTVNHRGDWLHVVLETADGLRGFGEASHGGFGPDRDAIVREILERQVRPLLADCDLSRVTATTARMWPLADGLAAATAVSATEQALWDLAGKAAGVPVSVLFGDASPGPIPLYANINRSVKERTPAWFAGNAAKAVSEEFTAIKLAPFDGVIQADVRSPEERAKVHRGIECVAAVRDAVGRGVEVMVDCHSAFDRGTAEFAARALAELGVHWFEEPLPLVDIEAHVALRRSVNALGMELVGGELLFGVEGFLPWLKAGAFDVIMPDVKHCGGLAALRAIAQVATASGAGVAPHNPSGPLATLASGHALAGVGQYRPLEIAWGEVPWRVHVVGGAEVVRDGALHLPAGPGLGVEAITAPAG